MSEFTQNHLSQDQYWMQQAIELARLGNIQPSRILMWVALLSKMGS
jgi:hypothetical protein